MTRLYFVSANQLNELKSLALSKYAVVGMFFMYIILKTF